MGQLWCPVFFSHEEYAFEQRFLNFSESPGELVKTQIARPHFQSFRFRGCKGGPEKLSFPSETAAADLGAALKNP